MRHEKSTGAAMRPELGLFLSAIFAVATADELKGSDATDASTVAVEVRTLAAGLAAYPQHADDVEELRSIVEEFEKTSVKVAALESGVQERSFGLSAPQISEQIATQTMRTNRLQQELQRKRLEAMEQLADESIEDAKSNYEESREQFKLAVRILQQQMERQSQVVQKIAQ